MTISRPCYCTREDVKAALDVKQTARNDAQVDRAIESGADAVDGLMHRVYYPQIDTRYVDWPNFQGAYPWRIWLDQAELADVTNLVPVVTSGGITIPAGDIFWGHPRYAPPYSYLELNRATSASFGQGSTPQRDVAITGQFGYTATTRSGGVLAAAMTDTTGTKATVSDGSQVGIGDNLLIDTERVLVTGRANIASGQTQQGPGAGTANYGDDVLQVGDGTQLNVGEVLTLDSERMLALDVTGNNVTVKRAWDGTVLATHTGATVYVSRLLTVVRGSQGTTAATHSSSAPVGVHLVPPLIRQLSLGEAVSSMTQEVAAYAAVRGSGAGAVKGVGAGLDALRTQAYIAHGRKARTRVI